MPIEECCARDLMSTDEALAEPHESLRTAVSRKRERSIHGLLVKPEGPDRGYSIITGKDCIDVLCHAGNDGLDDLMVGLHVEPATVHLERGRCFPAHQEEVECS